MRLRGATRTAGRTRNKNSESDTTSPGNRKKNSNNRTNNRRKKNCTLEHGSNYYYNYNTG